MRTALRLASLSTALAVVGGLLLAPLPTASSRTAAPQLTPTMFALQASGWGSRVVGGQLPVGSDESAFEVIGCTNKAGVNRRNYEADVNLGPLGDLFAVETDLWTEKNGGIVASNATHSIARVVLGDASTGRLVLRGVESTARAWHSASGFHAKTTANLLSVTAFAPGSDMGQQFAVPTPGHPLVIPGLARVAIPDAYRRVGSGRAKATVDAVRVDFYPTDTTVRLAHSSAVIFSGVKLGLFRGYSAGVRADALDQHGKVGRTPLLLMPCQGTHGQVGRRSLAKVELGDSNIVVRGLDDSQWAVNRWRRASGYEKGRVAHVFLTDGNQTLEVNGIVGRANVTRTRSGLTRNNDGTTLAEVLVNGKRRAVPKSGTFEIPGLVKLERGLTTRIRSGLRVIGLRLTLLDGSGATVDLGIAQLRVMRSGLRR